MDRSVRIAVVGPVDERLVGELRLLPLQPEVRPMPSLLGDGEALLRYQPDLLLIAFGARPDEDVGAARLLQRMWPALGVVVVARPDQELTAAPAARRLNARVLLFPDTPGHVAATLELVLQGSDRPRPELFLDLAHGLADEINNPLMFASGHLQLLRASFDPTQERDRRDQIDAALAGLQRIHSSVERLRHLSQSADGPRRRERVDVAQLIGDAIAARTQGLPTATVSLPHGQQFVEGDQEQLRLAMAAMVRFADDLAGLDTECHLSLQQEVHALRMRLVARGQGLAGWQLPQTFEPFYPQRALRGQSHGLGLFLLQTVILGHKGQATARRTADGTLQFDFLLPA